MSPTLHGHSSFLAQRSTRKIFFFRGWLSSDPEQSNPRYSGSFILFIFFYKAFLSSPFRGGSPFLPPSTAAPSIDTKIFDSLRRLIVKSIESDSLGTNQVDRVKSGLFFFRNSANVFEVQVTTFPVLLGLLWTSENSIIRPYKIFKSEFGERYDWPSTIERPHTALRFGTVATRPKGFAKIF